MSMRINATFRQPRPWMWTALLLAIAGLAIVRHLPWPAFGGGDQAKQAFASLDMVAEGAWFYPHLPTGRPATKPPLMAWLSASFRLVGLPWVVAWRLPSLLAFGVTGGWLVRRAMRVVGGWGTWIALACFGLNMMTIKMAAMIRTDMLLAFWIAAAAGLIADHVASGEPWSGRARALFSALVGAALFTKGPVILVFLPPALLVWRYANRHATPPGGPGIAPWGLPVLLFAGWAVIGLLRDPAFYDWVVRREFGNNFALTTVPDAGFLGQLLRLLLSLLTYPLQLLHRLFPWSIALVGWAAIDRAGRCRLWADAGARWWVLWLLVSVAAMSLVPDKRADRIFPVVPPMALLSAYAVRYQTRCPAPESLTRWIAVLTVTALLIWAPYTFLRMRRNSAGAEGTRWQFGEKVRAWAVAEGYPVVFAGPVTDADQSLLIHLRLSRWIPMEELPAALVRGEAVVAPEDRLLAAGPVEIILQQERAAEGGTRYALGRLPRAPRWTNAH